MKKLIFLFFRPFRDRGSLSGLSLGLFALLSLLNGVNSIWWADLDFLWRF